MPAAAYLVDLNKEVTGGEQVPSVSDEMAGHKDAETRATDENEQPTTQALEATTESATEQQSTSDGTTAEMPPNKPRSNAVRREADLSSLLNPSEKAELTALVTRVTESMLKHVTLLFDPVPDGTKVETSRNTVWSKLPYHLKDLSLHNPMNETQTRLGQKENIKPPRSKKAGRTRGGRGAAPGAADAPSQEEVEATPRLQELKKEALVHFRKWQTAVHRRVGEISVKKGPDFQPSPASAGPRRRPPPNKRGKAIGRTLAVRHPAPNLLTA